MEYIEDKDLKYKDSLLKELRAYNQKHTGPRESSTEYFYAFDGEKLVGWIQAKFSWDWVSIGDIFYENVKVLNTVISEICHYYKTKAVGIKLYTSRRSRVDDFVSIGFTIGGRTERTSKIPQYIYLKYIDLDKKSDSHTKVIISKEIIDEYKHMMSNRSETFTKENQIELEEETFMYVALDGDTFAGGIHGSMIEDSMTIDWLIVKEEYRGFGIGKTLVWKMEKKAKALGVYSINLGTVEFQAEKFYARLGYKIVFVKENDPKGYRSFSMVKKL